MKRAATRWRWAISLSVLGLAPCCSLYNPGLLDDGIDSDADGGAGGGDGDGDGDGGGIGVGGAGSSPGGSGGSLGGAPSGGDSNLGGAPDGGSTGSTYQLIDDMEDNNVAILVTGGRNGRWNTYNDGTAGTQVPEPDFSMMENVSADPPHGKSTYSAYTQGSDFTGFGAVLNVTMRSWPVYEETPPYDASEFVGLTFYAKAGADAGKTVRVRLVTTDTDPRGGNCEDGGATGDACYDHFLTEISLTETWERYELPFEDFLQTGVGKAFPAPATGGLYAIEFQCPGGSPFEIWVDDLAFIKP